MEATPTAATAQSTLLTPEAIVALPATPLGTGSGVTRRVLWQSASSEAGALTLVAGQRLGLHRHRVNHHHMWVIDGAAAIVGQTVHAGGYVHVPSGVEHDLDATATDGCTVFYIYEPPAT